MCEIYNCFRNIHSHVHIPIHVKIVSCWVWTGGIAASSSFPTQWLFSVARELCTLDTPFLVHWLTSSTSFPFPQCDQRLPEWAAIHWLCWQSLLLEIPAMEVLREVRVYAKDSIKMGCCFWWTTVLCTHIHSYTENQINLLVYIQYIYCSISFLVFSAL